MAFRMADPNAATVGLREQEERFRREAPTVATASGSTSTSTNENLSRQGPEGEFSAAANSPEARPYFNSFIDRLDYTLAKNGDIPPPPSQSEELGMTPEEKRMLREEDLA